MDLDAATDEYKRKGPNSGNYNWNINGYENERIKATKAGTLK